jgi:hypothetical protein
MALRYWPRGPRFPIIVDTGRGLVGALSGTDCAKRLARLGPFDDDAAMPVIDSTSEGFGFYPKMSLITPVTTKKRWTKAEVIAYTMTARKPTLRNIDPGCCRTKVSNVWYLKWCTFSESPNRAMDSDTKLPPI